MVFPFTHSKHHGPCRATESCMTCSPAPPRSGLLAHSASCSLCSSHTGLLITPECARRASEPKPLYWLFSLLGFFLIHLHNSLTSSKLLFICRLLNPVMLFVKLQLPAHHLYELLVLPVLLFLFCFYHSRLYLSRVQCSLLICLLCLLFLSE